MPLDHEDLRHVADLEVPLSITALPCVLQTEGYIFNSYHKPSGVRGGREQAMSEVAGILHSVKACSHPFPCGKQADLEVQHNMPKASSAKGSTHS